MTNTAVPIECKRASSLNGLRINPSICGSDNVVVAKASLYALMTSTLQPGRLCSTSANDIMARLSRNCQVQKKQIDAPMTAT